jgi:hypothetical protein
MKTNVCMLAVLAAFAPAIGHAGVLKDTGHLIGDEIQKHKDGRELNQNREEFRHDQNAAARDLEHRNFAGAAKELSEGRQEWRDMRHDNQHLSKDTTDIHQDEGRLRKDF